MIFFLCFLAAILASISGTGGGSLFIPIFSLTYASDVHNAIPLSKLAVFGVAIGACIVNSFKVRLENQVSNINYHLATLIQPATLLGCTIGVFLNLYLSSRSIVVALILILSIAAYLTFRSGMKQWRATRIMNDPLKKCLVSPTAYTAIRTFGFEGTPDTVPSPSSSSPDPYIIKAADKGRLLEFSLLSSCWGVNAFCLYNAGGPAALACGSIRQKTWVYSAIMFQASFILWTASRLMKKSGEAEFPRNCNIYVWATKLKMVYYTSLSCVAGICAGMLGIGGGLIKGPLLISLGLIPISAVATSNYMVLFTSSTNVLAFFLAGRLKMDSSLFYGLSGICGALVGVSFLRNHLSEFNRQHVLTLILGFSIVLGGISMVAVDLINGTTHDELTFADACSHVESTI